jgi:ATP-dependent DNA helicase RecQ
MKANRGLFTALAGKRVEELTEMLQVNGIKALAYHAGMDAAYTLNKPG